MRIWYTISYDIVNDKLRKKVESICSTYGQRVQKSVFEAYLTMECYQLFQEKLHGIEKEKMWNKNVDSIIIYKHCASCHRQKKVQGKTIEYSEHGLFI